MGTVTQAMKDAGLYKDAPPATRDELRTTFIDEQTVELGGKQYDLSRISYLDAKIFADELDGKLSRLNPIIHDVFAKYGVNCFDLVRMVNVNSKQGFKGSSGSGNELDAIPFLAKAFYDPDSSTAKRSSWVRTIASTGSKLFFEGATASAELTMSEEEGQIWLAMYNPAVTPCVAAFLITMNADPHNLQGLDFDQMHTQLGEVLIEFKEPWTLPPEQSGKIDADYFQTGTDEMRPIGLWVKMARNLRAITTP